MIKDILVAVLIIYLVDKFEYSLFGTQNSLKLLAITFFVLFFCKKFLERWKK